MSKMDITSAIKGRRSIRSFTDKTIKKEDIEKIIDAGQWAPSACNKQAWKFIVIDDQKLKETLVSNTGATPIMKISPLTIAVFYHKKINEENYANIQSASAAIQNMILTAHSLGIGSVWACTFRDREKISSILNVPKQYMLIAFVCMGYPKKAICETSSRYHSGGDVKAPDRKEIKKILSYNRFKFDDIYPNSYKLKDWTFEQAINYFSDAIYATSPNPDAYMGGFIGKEVGKQIEIVIPKLFDNKKMLEIFPYSGKFCLNILKQKKLNYSVLEFDKRIADFFTQRKKNMGIEQPIEIYLTETLKIPAKDESFDNVLFFENIGSIPGYEEFIKEMYRVLKPGGTLFISFKNSISFTNLYHKLFGRGEVKPMQLLSTGHMKRMLSDAGFKEEKMYGISLSPLSLGKTTPIFKPLSRIILLECRK